MVNYYSEVVETPGLETTWMKQATKRCALEGIFCLAPLHFPSLCSGNNEVSNLLLQWTPAVLFLLVTKAMNLVDLD